MKIGRRRGESGPVSGRAGPRKYTVTSPTQVLVGRPATIPAGFEAALAEVFAAHQEVAEAYLGWKVVPSTGDQSYLLVIVATPEPSLALNDDLGRLLPRYGADNPIDVTFAKPGDDHLLTSIEPTYRASSAGGS